jgi:hypothetical protein
MRIARKQDSKPQLFFGFYWTVFIINFRSIMTSKSGFVKLLIADVKTVFWGDCFQFKFCPNRRFCAEPERSGSAQNQLKLCQQPPIIELKNYERNPQAHI